MLNETHNIVIVSISSEEELITLGEPAPMIRQKSYSASDLSYNVIDDNDSTPEAAVPSQFPRQESLSFSNHKYWNVTFQGRSLFLVSFSALNLRYIVDLS